MTFVFTILVMAISSMAGPEKTVNPFYCNGLYGSYTCEHTLYLDNCKETIKVRWDPLLYPGLADFKSKKRAYCSVTWNSVESIEERKFQAVRCDKIMNLIGAAQQGFPEVQWRDQACPRNDTREAVLHSRQVWEKPTAPLSDQMPRVARPANTSDTPPKSIGLEDVRYCTLRNAVLKRERLGTNDQTPVAPNKVKALTKRIVHCPVLPQNVYSWLSKFLIEIDGQLVLQNDLK